VLVPQTAQLKPRNIVVLIVHFRQLLYFTGILVKQPDEGRQSDRNM